ncbi:MAG TPA: VapC toxin family PIN domain ribonuclease [Anaerolineae bacterium]|nr:VapC toxin family PIN domain ribonuclease [Anaerolineae bacterium]HMR65778.1 VapC toxin family PIN domain ribonuclease [Anaerolineae bacterium]
MTTYLLDINLLLALSDPMHVHHDLAHHWFAQTGHHSWATCPLTENGFVRITSHPKYPNRPGDVATMLEILRQLCEVEGHEFWAEDISIRNLLEPGAIISPSHITDIYLLGLSLHKGGKLATLDQRIPVSVVQGGLDALELIGNLET